MSHKTPHDSDYEFMKWLENRMIHVYGESENVDFLHRLRRIQEKVKLVEQLQELR